MVNEGRAAGKWEVGSEKWEVGSEAAAGRNAAAWMIVATMKRMFFVGDRCGCQTEGSSHRLHRMRCILWWRRSTVLAKLCCGISSTWPVLSSAIACDFLWRERELSFR